MKKGLILFLYLLFSFTVSAQLKINELMPKNISAVRDEFTNYSMWVELYNASDREVELAGYFFSDDSKSPRKWNPDAKTIPAGGFEILWFEREDRSGHASFKLKPEGGVLYLFNRSGLVVDKVHYPPQYRNVSYGRLIDGEDSWSFFATASPGASNSEGRAAIARCPNPEFKLNGGFYDGPRYFGFNTPSRGDIYYTLDGSEPNINSTKYRPGASVYISKTTVLRAICLAEDCLPSDLLTTTYFIGERNFDLPVVSLVADPVHLWDNMYGIYVDGINGIPGNGQSQPKNYNQDWSRPANFELIDTSGVLQINQELDIAIAGGWTRAHGLKSLKIQPRTKFGNNHLDYDFFPVSKPGQLYKDILLRNSGNDNGRTQMRDGFTVSILQNRIDLEYMAYEPAVLFINGRYYGIENLRERSNKDLIYCNYGLEEEDIILDGVPDVDLFPLTPEYGELHQFIEELDMTSDTAFMAVCRRINMENYLHYQLFEIYVGNTDWPHNNFKLWKRKVDGKWRWIVFDLDFGFNGVNGPAHNTLAHALGEGNSWGQWSTMMFRRLMLNTEFRQRFIDNFCVELSKTLEPERVIAILDSMAPKIANEIVYHKQRWGSSADFYNDLESIRSFARQRPNNILNQLSSRYLGGVSNGLIRLSANHPQASYYLNRAYIQDAEIDLRYFLQQNINIRAARVQGMQFSHWEVNKGGGIDQLIANGANWRYYYTSHSPGEAWNSPAYNDQSWSQGPAQFGYGGKGEVTVLDYGNYVNKYPTAYFRKEIQIDDLANKNSFLLSIFVDDGAVIYVNGQELARLNMPAGTITYNTYASSANNGLNAEYDVPLNMLKEGSNLIAVEVHQVSASSSDLIFDLAMSCVDMNGNIQTLTEEVYSGIFDSELSLRAIYEEDPHAADIRPTVLINEIVASNNRIADEYGEKDDYIELYNYGEEDLNIAGWYLSDLPMYPFLGRIAATDSAQTVLPAKSWICLWADGTPEQGPLHLNFKLNLLGESVSLSKKDEFGRLMLIDSVSYPPLDRNMSYSRIPDGGSVWEIQEPSFGASNLLAGLKFNIEEREIEVYPSLVKSSISVRNAQGLQFSLFDFAGRPVCAGFCVDPVEIIDLSGLQPGLYILKVDGQVFKLIKQ